MKIKIEKYCQILASRINKQYVKSVLLNKIFISTLVQMLNFWLDKYLNEAKREHLIESEIFSITEN